jgi:uncharacterized protein
MKSFPIGPIFDSVATLAGAFLGALYGTKIPLRIRTSLPQIFGLLSMALGIVSITKVHAMPVIILSILIGTSVGIWLNFEQKIEQAAITVNNNLQRYIVQKNKTDTPTSNLMKEFVSVLILFSASGTGIFGAMSEGATHETTILLSKAILDFFTAIIFATSIGALVAAAVVPQLIILLAIFYMGKYILPFTTPEMLANFSACGGVIMLATGLRICNIKNFPIANMLFALVFVFFISALWYKLF